MGGKPREIWNLQPGLVDVELPQPLLRGLAVDDGGIVGVEVLVRDCDAEGTVLALVHREGEGGTARRNVVGPPRPHDQALPVLVVGAARSLNDQEDGSHGEEGHGEGLAGAARHDHDLELRDGGGVADDAGVAVAGGAGIDGRPAHAVGEHVDQVGNVLELGSQTGPDYVVAARHALDDLARDVGVGLVGGHEEGLAGSDEEVVEEEGRHGPGVVGELLRQAEDGAGALALPGRALVIVRVEALLLVEAAEEETELLGGYLGGAVHEGREETPEGLGLLLGLGSHEHAELGFVRDAGGELRMLLEELGDLLDAAEAAHGLEGG